MWLRPLFSSALLGLTGLCDFASDSGSESNLSLYGAPRHNLDPVLPILDIEEKYIRSQTDGGVTAFGITGLQCSASNPCLDGSCCNDQGRCGYRDEHCKETCVANCNAKAPCGIDSKDGSQSCPLNLCCSHFGFCGASESFCRDYAASGKSTPCQKGFGRCGTVDTKSTPSCGKGSGTASRRVAYYEGWNTRRRPCDKVWPAQIDTGGLTQIVFSFATIDPDTFAVGPMHPNDEKLYVDFLGLKDGSQKWIGIGGWEFSDAGPSHQTWSLMASSKANRQVFISSLLEFLEKWNFAGVDIDWEWPGADTRGGNAAIDKQNQVDLMKELRAALGSRGLSVVLPAQYAYLQNLDPKALEGSVDAFNFLAYDLHGPWDSSIPDLGPYTKPHTDLNEIDDALGLLWSADVTPSKVNLGIANYGRGFVLADSDCAYIGCKWTGPSKAGLCTQLDGVLSQCEIERTISQNSLKPELIEGAGIKQIVFDGQWFGYDDQQTFALKIELANNRCLGGTALWAIDYASCTGGGPVGPDGPQQSSTGPPSPAPGISTASRVSSGAAVPSESVALSTTYTISSAPAESSKPVASSTTSSASAKPPAPVPSSTPSLTIPTTSEAESTTSSNASRTSSVVTSKEPSSGNTTQASTIPTVPLAPSSTEYPTSPVGPSPSGVPTASITSEILSFPVISSRSSAFSTSSTMSPARSSAEPGPSSSRSSNATTISSDLSTWSWSATSNAARSSETMSWSSQTSASSRSIMPSGAQESSTITVSSASLWSSAQSQSGSSQSGSSSAVTPGTTSAQFWSASSSDTTRSWLWSSPSDETSMWLITMSTATTEASDTSVWTWPAGTSGKMSSGTQSGSKTTHNGMPEPSKTSRLSLTSIPAFTRTSDGSIATMTDSAVETTITSAVPIVTPSPISDPNAYFGVICPDCSEHSWCKDALGLKQIHELPEYPVKECVRVGNEWCPNCWPKPPEYLPEMCPWQCWLEEWCKPLCFHEYPPDPPEEGVQLPWFMSWWWTLPVPGCVPNDCVDECHSWFGVSIALFKQPFCSCVPVTCSKGEEHEKKTGKKKCRFLGCGCGFMGLPFICDIDISIDWKILLPHGVFFNPNPCYWFGCPPGIGPEPGPPGGAGQQCGILGCNGYCYDPLGTGCDPCPPELCPEISPKPGIDPSPVKSRLPPKKCEEKDKTTVTERIVSCFEDLSLNPTKIASLNYTQTSTLISACLTFDATISGCGLLGASSTTTIKSATTSTLPITPAPTPTPGAPKECEEKDKTTITKKIVSCFESLKLVPTTVVSLNSTRTETLTTSCSTREETSTVCQGIGLTTTTTVTSFTRTSSERPNCSRAPLDLSNDEGDNPQPPRDVPSCQSVPLSLSDDEGDNEHLQSPFCPLSPLSLEDDEGDNSQPEAPSCTRAPLSLDDDEGNNEMPDDTGSGNGTISWTLTNSRPSTPSREAPPSTLSDFTTAPWGTGIPTGTPGTLQCLECDRYFAKCVKDQCKPNGSDAEHCAKSCLSQLCWSSESPDYCKTGTCKPSACPKESPRIIAPGEPGDKFTTTLSLPSTTMVITATPPYSEPTLSHSPTPTCTHGQEISPHAKWTVLIDHKIHQRPDNATLTWNLWDEHGCHAGNGMSSNAIVGRNVTAEIGAMGRPQKDMMGFMLQANVTESMTSSSSEIYFQISKPVAGCQHMCHTSWKVNNRDQSNSWQIVSDCAQACGMRELGPEDVFCDNVMNKWQENGDNPTDIRGGYCTFRMPFEPMDDSAPPPSAPWTRNSQWTVDFIQQMEYKTASIEWWLRDPDGNNVSHFVRQLDSGADEVSAMIESDPSIPAEKRMRYKMLMTVTNPMNKDKTRILLTYQNDRNKHCHYCEKRKVSLARFCVHTDWAYCQPNYQTESNDEKEQSLLQICSEPNTVRANQPCGTPMIARNDTFSCDPVAAAFYPKDAGFERRFRCWWPNDFDAPYGRDDEPPPFVDWDIIAEMGDDMGSFNGTAGVMGVDSGSNG